VRTLIHDDLNVLHYPTYTHNQGKDYGWQQMLLIRNGVCPNLADTEKCFLNPPMGTPRKGRCGACKMDKGRGDMYFVAMTKPTKASVWHNPSAIRKKYGGARENIVMYGISAINKGYKSEGQSRSFHLKSDMWLEFKRACGFECKTDAGLRFLPNTFSLSNEEDLSSFKAKYFDPRTTYLAKGEVDAKQSIKFVKADTAKELLQKVQSDGKAWTVLQEMITNPALAKYGDNPGFKVNMRTFFVLSCTQEKLGGPVKPEWTMLRAGSHLHYAMEPYSDTMDFTKMDDFNAFVDTSYNAQDLYNKGNVKWEDINRWPSSNIAYLENLKEQGWTDSTEKEWEKIEGIFRKAASVYDGIVCNEEDAAHLQDAGKLVFLVGADILMAGSEVDGKRTLQPYLIEWNTGPAFGDSGHPDDFEHKQITEIALMKKAGILPRVSWIPKFLQPEYNLISPRSFSEEGVVWKTIA